MAGQPDLSNQSPQIQRYLIGWWDFGAKHANSPTPVEWRFPRGRRNSGHRQVVLRYSGSSRNRDRANLDVEAITAAGRGQVNYPEVAFPGSEWFW